MKLLLAVYLIISALVDPWVDGVAEVVFSTEVQIQASDLNNAGQPAFVLSSSQSSQKHNHHDNCPESCPDHTCHLGHCGFLINIVTLLHIPISGELYSEYKQALPNPFINGLKRPPKSIA